MPVEASIADDRTRCPSGSGNDHAHGDDICEHVVQCRVFQATLELSRVALVQAWPHHGHESVVPEALESLEVAGRIGPFLARLHYELEPHLAGTRLTNTVDLEGRGVVLAAQIAGRPVKRAVASNLGESKAILERQPV